MLLWSGYGGLAVAVLWAVTARAGDRIDRLFDRAGALLDSVPRTAFVCATSAAAIVLSAVVSHYSFAGLGSTGDELAMGWHARILLAGHLAIPAAPHPEFYNTVAVVDQGGRWYSQYPIGGPALLAAGMAFRAPWLVNPLLLGVATWQLHRFARVAFGERTARAAVLLFVLTPFVLVLSATQLNHAPVLALALLALAQLAAWDAGGDRRTAHAVVLGLAVGAISLVRPLDAALVAIPIGVFQMVRARGSVDRWRDIALQCAAGAVPVALLLWSNAHTTGSPLLFAYDAANGPAHRIGFHVDPNGELHTVRRGLVYLSGYLLRFNRFLFEWPLPALLVVCATLFTLRRGSRWDSLLLALLAVFLLGYGAYWFPGFFDGPRFLLPVAPVLVLYAARLGEAAASYEHPVRRRVAQALVPVCVMLAWVVPLPFSSVPSRLAALRDQRTKLKTDVRAEAARAGLSNAVVLVLEPWRGRLLARLRAGGVDQFEAERIVNRTDACALQLALDAEDALPAPPGGGARGRRAALSAAASGPARLQRTSQADDLIARSPTGPDHPRCRQELEADAFGTMPYAMFLREQEVLRDGRPGGDVIWVRDLGPRDSLLRPDLGSRRWYRYRPGATLHDTGAFVPVSLP